MMSNSKRYIDSIRATDCPTQQALRAIGTARQLNIHIDLPEEGAPDFKTPYSMTKYQYENLIGYMRGLLTGVVRDCPEMDCQAVFYYDHVTALWHCTNERCRLYHTPVDPDDLAAFDAHCRQALPVLQGDYRPIFYGGMTA